MESDRVVGGIEGEIVEEMPMMIGNPRREDYKTPAATETAAIWEIPVRGNWLSIAYYARVSI